MKSKKIKSITEAKCGCFLYYIYTIYEMESAWVSCKDCIQIQRYCIYHMKLD